MEYVLCFMFVASSRPTLCCLSRSSLRVSSCRTGTSKTAEMLHSNVFVMTVTCNMTGHLFVYTKILLYHYKVPNFPKMSRHFYVDGFDLFVRLGYNSAPKWKFRTIYAVHWIGTSTSTRYKFPVT